MSSKSLTDIPTKVGSTSKAAVNTSGHVWVSREAVGKLKGSAKLPDLNNALQMLEESEDQMPFVFARVFPDASGRADMRRVQLAEGSKKELPASTAVLLNANPENGAAPDSDAALISHLNEPSLLRLIHQRYEQRQIYTRAGPVLVAMNPFESMEQELYGPKYLALYQGQRPRAWSAHRTCTRWQVRRTRRCEAMCAARKGRRASLSTARAARARRRRPS